MSGRLGARLRAVRPATWAAAVAAAAGLAFGAYALLEARGYESTDDAFVQGTLTRIAARIAGEVQEVRVQEHARVAAGALLVKLDPADHEARVARARADLAAARNRMDAAAAAAAAAEAERKAAEVERWRASRELERVQALARRGAASDQELDAARAARDAARARVQALGRRAEAERAVLGNEAPLRQAEAALRQAELDLAHTEIRAPFAGVVGRRGVEPGAIVQPGQTLLALAADAPAWVTANFKETQVARMQVGSPARVEVDAIPGVVWRGHVDSFSPATGSQYALIPPEPASGNFTKVVQRIPVRIALDAVEQDGDGAAHGFLTTDLLGPLPVGLSAHVRVVVR